MLAPPPVISPRDWILGVVAVQAGVGDAGRVTARLRAHTTGAKQPTVIALGDGAIVHVALGNAPTAPPAIEAPPLLDGDAARLAVYYEGRRIDEAALPRSQIAARPSPRGFGHVFCRWLRDGGHEAGFDLTDFLSLPEGTKYARRVSRGLGTGQIVSYAVRLAS